MNNEWGYRTTKHKRLGGNEIGKNTLYKIFTNPFYYGEYEYSGKWYAGKHERMITREEYDRVQSILGKKGKQRPKTREFAFTGMVRCGECGGMVTAEEKINRYGSRYIYYHCTKRLNVHCTQKSIQLGEFERQADYLLSQIEIPESFKDWAIKHLNELHDKEATDQTTINKSVDSAYSDCIEKINNLVKLKISPMNSDGSVLSDAEFEKQMKELKEEKKSLEDKKKNVGERVNQWLELSTKTFNFACYARYHFEHTESLQIKREILATVGSNFELFNKIVRISVPKPFLANKTAKVETDKIIAQFEPEEIADNTAKLMALYSKNLTLQGRRESNSY